MGWLLDGRMRNTCSGFSVAVQPGWPSTRGATASARSARHRAKASAQQIAASHRPVTGQATERNTRDAVPVEQDEGPDDPRRQLQRPAGMAEGHSGDHRQISPLMEPTVSACSAGLDCAEAEMPERQAEGRDHHPEHRHVQRPEQADLPDAFVVPARRAAGGRHRWRQTAAPARVAGAWPPKACSRAITPVPTSRATSSQTQGLTASSLPSPRWVKNGSRGRRSVPSAPRPATDRPAHPGAAGHRCLAASR